MPDTTCITRTASASSRILWTALLLLTAALLAGFATPSAAQQGTDLPTLTPYNPSKIHTHADLRTLHTQTFAADAGCPHPITLTADQRIDPLLPNKPLPTAAPSAAIPTGFSRHIYTLVLPPQCGGIHRIVGILTLHQPTTPSKAWVHILSGHDNPALLAQLCQKFSADQGQTPTHTTQAHRAQAHSICTTAQALSQTHGRIIPDVVQYIANTNAAAQTAASINLAEPQLSAQQVQALMQAASDKAHALITHQTTLRKYLTQLQQHIDNKTADTAALDAYARHTITGTLAQMLAAGLGGPRDLAQALRLAEKDVSFQGWQSEQYRWGTSGFPRDLSRYRELREAIASRMGGPAARGIGQRYAGGLAGWSQDNIQALAWYRYASVTGSDAAWRLMPPLEAKMNPTDQAAAQAIADGHIKRNNITKLNIRKINDGNDDELQVIK